jgi:hypothetical protein
VPEGKVQNKRELFPSQIPFGPERRGFRLNRLDGRTLDEPRTFLLKEDENYFCRLTFQHVVAVVHRLLSSERACPTVCPISPTNRHRTDAVWKVREARC